MIFQGDAHTLRRLAEKSMVRGCGRLLPKAISEARCQVMAALHHPDSPLILIVDDDVGDQILIREALESSKIAKQVRSAGDGEEAVAYLRRVGAFAVPASSPRPSLILLDLNMPRLCGKEVLALLKSDPDLKSIPVVVFTTSSREEDVIECYRMGANSYVPKPADFAEFQSVMQNLELYWLQVSSLPGCGPPAGRLRSPGIA